MSVMDLKGITFAGNIYQKFEAMCLELEEVMYQDTAKYLENQVEIIGSSVKKFYSEVMQDIFPPDYVDPVKVADADPVKVADADLPLNPHSLTEVFKKPKVTMKLDLMKMKNTEEYKMVGDINAENIEAVAKLDYTTYHTKGDNGNDKIDSSCKISKETNLVSEILCEATSFCQLRKESVMCSVSDGVCDAKEARYVDNSVCTSTAAPVDSPASDVNLSSDIKEPNPEISPEISDTDSDSKRPARMESKIDTICGSAPDEAYFSSEGRLDNSKIDTASNDTGLVITERLDDSKFEDTCVLVEGKELQGAPPKQKKFQEDSPLRMEPTRKQEYKRIAAQDSAHSSKQVGMEQHSKDLPDSEWELL